MIEIEKGDIVNNWRGHPCVQRIELKLDGDRVRKAIQQEIVRQAKKQKIALPDLNNEAHCDPWLRVFAIGDGPLDEYCNPYICHATLSFYEDIQP